MKLTDNRARPLRFVRNDNDCMIPISHRLNTDGYFRKCWGSQSGGTATLEMFHRFIYRAHKGPIPEGFEVDHKCHCRPCCNPEHLRAIDGLEHTIHTNRTRWLRCPKVTS